MIIRVKDELTGNVREYSDADWKELLRAAKKEAGLKPRGAVYLNISVGSSVSPILRFYEFGTGRRTEARL